MLGDESGGIGFVGIDGKGGTARRGGGVKGLGGTGGGVGAVGKPGGGAAFFCSKGGIGFDKGALNGGLNLGVNGRGETQDWLDGFIFSDLGAEKSVFKSTSGILGNEGFIFGISPVAAERELSFSIITDLCSGALPFLRASISPAIVRMR
ncbi:MAG: hypothetical protein AAB670_01800 [Patescibacteria group bacterium]